MIPKLGLTAENIKSFEEAKSDDAGIRNELYKPTWIEINIAFKTRSEWQLVHLVSDRAYLMLTTWSKQEGEAATKEEMIYVLDGLVASKAINKASYEEVFNWIGFAIISYIIIF